MENTNKKQKKSNSTNVRMTHFNISLLVKRCRGNHNKQKSRQTASMKLLQ